GYKRETNDDHNKNWNHDLAVVENLFQHKVSISTLPLGGHCLPILQPIAVSQMPALYLPRRWQYLRLKNGAQTAQHATPPHEQSIVSRLCRCLKNSGGPRAFHKLVAYMQNCNTSLACLYPGL